MDYVSNLGFWDDWDDGRLRFEVEHVENPALVRATLEGSVLSFMTLPENWFGTLRFRVRAYDSEGLWTDSNMFNVTVTPVNDPPVQSREIAPRSFPEDTDALRLLDLKDCFWDIEDERNLGFTITFEENASLLHAVLEGSLLSFYTPTENWHGTMRFRVRATDSGGLFVDGREFKVTVDPVNDAPVTVRNIPDQSFPEDTDAIRLVSLDERFQDVDGDALSYEVVYEENAHLIHAVLDGGWLSFYTPTENWFGTLRFRIRARDAGGLTAESNTFNVTVTPVNDAPVLAHIPDRSVSVGSMVKIDIAASDIENDTLVFGTNSARHRVQPTAGKYGAGTVRFIAEQAGTIYLNITVSDGNGGVTYQRVRIIISEKTDRYELCYSLGLVTMLIAGAITAARHHRGNRKRKGAD